MKVTAWTVRVGNKFCGHGYRLNSSLSEACLLRTRKYLLTMLKTCKQRWPKKKCGIMKVVTNRYKYKGI